MVTLKHLMIATTLTGLVSANGIKNLDKNNDGVPDALE